MQASSKGTARLSLDVTEAHFTLFLCFFVLGVTGELSTLRQLMKVPNEPGLSPNKGLENVSLSDQSTASNPRKGQAKCPGNTSGKTSSLQGSCSPAYSQACSFSTNKASPLSESTRNSVFCSLASSIASQGCCEVVLRRQKQQTALKKPDKSRIAVHVFFFFFFFFFGGRDIHYTKQR